MKRLAIYARVSTDEQSVDAQVDALTSYAERRGVSYEVFADEGESGAKVQRPQLMEMMRRVRLREFDAIGAVRLDRLARSLFQLTEIAAELEALGVDLIITEQAVDTTTPTGKLTFGILASVSEFERSLIVERTRSGIAAAQRRGVKFGRREVLTGAHLEQARRLRGQGDSFRTVQAKLAARDVRVSLGALHRALAA